MASLPIAAGALLAARPFTRAAVRYRILASAFVLTAAVGPAALLAASLRPAGSRLAATGGADLLGILALPAELVASAAAVALLVELACDVVKLRRVKRNAVALGTAPVRRAQIGTSRTVSTPTAIGYLHPAVVLPDNFRARVDEREWNAVVAHECAHLARGDDWAKAVQSAVTRAGWWLPGLWILGRGLDLERELASDERAMVETGPRHYAACLLRLATDREGAELAPAFARRSHVAIRVERLLRPSADSGPLRRAAALGAFTAAALAVVAAALSVVPGTARHGMPQPHPARLAAHAVPRAAVTHVAMRKLAPLVQRRGAATVALAVADTVSGRVAEPPSRAPSAARPAALPRASAGVKAVARAEAASPAVVAVRPGRRPASIARARVAGHEVDLGQLAFVAPSLRCRTCFGPLRSPDDAVALSTPSLSLPPPAGASGNVGAAAIAVDDPTSGPVSLGSRTVWFRIPARAIPAP